MTATETGSVTGGTGTATPVGRNGNVTVPVADTSVWRRTVVGWHVAFWAVLAVAAASSAFSDLSAGERTGYLGLLAVLGAAYALAGQPAASSRDRLRSRSYLLVLVVVLGLVAAAFPNAMLVLYIAYPQVWFLSGSTREGVVWSALLTASVATGVTAAGDWEPSALADAAPSMLASLGVSLVLGLWISRVIDQSEGRAELIAALHATRTELAGAHHAAGVTAERERVAREIHDTLAQGFTSIAMLAETATAQLARDRPDLAARHLALIEETARDNLAEARSLVAAFSPVALHEGLPDALRRLVERFAAETGLAATVRCLPDDDAVAGLHAGQQVVLLRVAQEALANVRKHAHASRVGIVVTAGAAGGATSPDGREPGHPPAADDASAGASIEVADDGRGFDPGSSRPGAFGLAGMRARVEEAGGQVVVASAPGAGTRVRILLPMDASASPQAGSPSTRSPNPSTARDGSPAPTSTLAPAGSERVTSPPSPPLLR